MAKNKVLVGILMGSKSDAETMGETEKIMKKIRFLTR